MSELGHTVKGNHNSTANKDHLDNTVPPDKSWGTDLGETWCPHTFGHKLYLTIETSLYLIEMRYTVTLCALVVEVMYSS